MSRLLTRRNLVFGSVATAGLAALAAFRKSVKSRVSKLTIRPEFVGTPALLPHDPSTERRTLFVARGASPAQNVDDALAKFGGLAKVVGTDDVVLLRVSAQWWNQGMTNVAAAKRMIEQILEVPGFKGEVIVFENTHFRLGDGNPLSRAWVRPSERNVDVPGWKTLGDLIPHFASRNVPVSFVGLVDAGPSELSEGEWHDPGRKHGVYGGDGRGPIAPGEVRDGYVWDFDGTFRVKKSLVETAAVPLTWPVFVSPRSGLLVDFKEGAFRVEGGRKIPSGRKITFLNMVTTNEHASTGFTGAVKSAMGLVDMSAGRLGTDPRILEYLSVHYFGNPEATWRMAGPLAHFAKNVRRADLVVAVAEWVGSVPKGVAWDEESKDLRLEEASAFRTNTVVVGEDPVAIDAWCVKNLVSPIGGGRPHLWNLDDPNSKVTRFLRDYRAVAGGGRWISPIRASEGAPRARTGEENSMRRTNVGIAACLWTLGGTFAATTASTIVGEGVAEARPAPTGAHPRLFLTPGVVDAMKRKVATKGSGAERVVAQCQRVLDDPNDWDTESWDLGIVATSCALAFRLTGEEKFVAPAVKRIDMILARGNDTVRRDSGFDMRIYPPYVALAYDWLHDRPEVAAKKATVLERFGAWFDWYTKSGYLPHTPGSNYQAGYLYASTLMAVAIGGESPVADGMWTTVVDELFAKDMEPASANGKVLSGGDWPEGWQYGPLSVLEYALASRALEEQGIPVPYMSRFLSEIPLRTIYGAPPGARKIFVGGDWDSTEYTMDLPPRSMFAVLVGNASDEAKSWARDAIAKGELTEDNMLRIFEALAEASEGESKPFPKTSPLTYVTRSTRVVFSRSSWEDDASWGAFLCPPRLVPDHQHVDAGNWVMTRGKDDLVVDPTPYEGTLSTLTGNAPAVDSDVMPESQRPSQQWFTLFGKEDLAWTRAFDGGLAVSRGNYADAFRHDEDASDVPVAVRDWIFVPNGKNVTTVVVDRVETGSSKRGAHLRIRTKPKLTLEGSVAKGTFGNSTLYLNQAFATSGKPTVRSIPEGDCPYDDDNRGRCDAARFEVGEVKIDLTGPSVQSIVVADGVPKDAAMPGSRVTEGDGFRVVDVPRDGAHVAVVVAKTVDPSRASFTYTGPKGATHVVLDAPTGSGGRSDVVATLAGDACSVVVTAREGTDGGSTGRPLVVDLGETCGAKAKDDVAIGVDPGTGRPADPAPGAGTAGTSGAAAGDSGKGGGCGVARPSPETVRFGSLATLALVSVALTARRRRRTP
ncbi:MAG: DUF362 domain-containing protein [Polyangiaceae bacterium]